jgi:outer membrane protein
MKFKFQKWFFIPLMFLSTVSAHAYETGDWLVKVGMASVSPDVSSDALALNGTELSQLSLGLPVTYASVNDNQQLGLTITKMLSPHWGLEVLAATPFTHEIEAEALGVKAAEAKHLPPTVSLQYFPMRSDSKFQPYVGLGINYTIFFGEQVDTELDSALGTLGATGGADLELDNSWGLAAQLGFDYRINNKWMFSTSFWYMDINTTATFDVPGLGTIAADVELDPSAYLMSLGYQF